MAQGTERLLEQWTYDVFLSFRGADVRKNFLSHLYNGFKRCGISTFMDDVELERGEYISKQLLEAIETSKILIVVLSKDYASSAWCLDELVHIMKSHKNNHSKLVFPIFFYVDPSDIRRQKGSYAQSFSKHKSRRYPANRVKDWREALTKVANLSGWDIRHWNEAECIEDITREILKRLPCHYLHVHPYVVGMRSRLQHISSLLSIGPDEVRVIGIYGMSGIGKTTLAKLAFNEFSHLFEGSSFLENFREYSKKPEGRTHLQHQLLTDILKRNDIGFNGLDHAMKERFRNKRLLIVVDDVDDIHQINSAAIDPSCFGHGSRIIITTRNMHLLNQLQVEESYSPEALNGDESLELFSWHAFRTSEPPEEFLQLSENVVTYSAGLPLAVEVLGAFLIERSISEWKSTLELLKQIPNQNIQAKLRISFDALDSVHKDVFLDIACFFIGMDRDYVACILDGCNLYPDIVLSVLIERCLITVSGNNIMMHDLIRDMGRQIVREISSKKRGEHSRLWNPDDVISVLRKKSGTNAVEGLSFKARVTDVWSFEVEAFTEMQEMRLLQLNNVNLNGSYEHFPEDLRWLCWHGFSSEFFPTNLSIRSLVVLDMQWSNLKRFSKAQTHPQQANMIKYLDLSNSVYLIETPDFSYLPNVEKLLLVNCKSLVLVHKSIGILHKKLVLLNLSRCIELDSLPEEFYKLKSLETLILSHCSKFERFDDALGDLESLTTLNADLSALKEIHSSINQLKKLKTLSLDGCKGLLSVDTVIPYSEKNSSPSMLLPVSLSGLSFLKTLSLAYCNLSDDMIPKDIGSLSFLEKINLTGNHFCNLKVDFASLTSLHMIILNDCSKLQSILSLPRSLLALSADDCILLERTPNLSECPKLRHLLLNGCLSLVETPGIYDPKYLMFLFANNCKLISNTCKKLVKEWIKKYHNYIYLPGYDTPNWIRFKAEMCSFSFTVPESHNSGPVTGFTLWARFLVPMVGDYRRPCPLTVKNLTRDSSLHTIYDDYYSNIFNNDFCIETGDQIEVVAGYDDGVTVLEIGFALSYNPIDSFDFSARDSFRCEGHRMSWDCSRSMHQTCVYITERRDNSVNQVVPHLWAYSFFPETSRDQENYQPEENNQPVVEERHHRSNRKMIMGIAKILGIICCLLLAMVLGKYGKKAVEKI